MINSNDIISKTNNIMDRIYFDGLTSKEQKVAVDGIVLSYTKNKLKNYVQGVEKYADFMDLLIVMDYSFENEEERKNFYDNYSKFFINLMGRKQKMPITWEESFDVEKPELKSRIVTGIVDNIVTNSETDPLLNLSYMYNLYKSDMKYSILDDMYSVRKNYR